MGYGPVRKARGMHGCAFPGFIRPTVIFYLLRSMSSESWNRVGRPNAEEKQDENSAERILGRSSKAGSSGGKPLPDTGTGRRGNGTGSSRSNDTLSDHSIGNFDKAGCIGSNHEITRMTILFRSFHTGAINIGHNLAQFVVYFFK